VTETSVPVDGSPLTREPVKEFGFRSAFALSFADLSPIVGIYTVFAIGIVAAGPAFIWAASCSSAASSATWHRGGRCRAACTRGRGS
jgi:hypothetical protein